MVLGVVSGLLILLLYAFITRTKRRRVGHAASKAEMTSTHLQQLDVSGPRLREVLSVSNTEGRREEAGTTSRGVGGAVRKRGPDEESLSRMNRIIRRSTPLELESCLCTARITRETNFTIAAPNLVLRGHYYD